MSEYPAQVNVLLTEYVTIQHTEYTHPLKPYQVKRATSRQSFLRRRMIEIIGETKTNKLIKGTLDAFQLLKG